MRALQLGLSYIDAFFLDVGLLKDLLTERSNDSFEYAQIGGTEEIDKLFGG